MTLPSEVDRFLRANVDSIAALETLLFLHASPTRSWTVDELARELRLSSGGVGQCVAALLRRGLVREERAGGVGTYGIAGDPDDATLALLATCYRAQPSAVISSIFSKPSAGVSARPAGAERTSGPSRSGSSGRS